MKNNEQLQQEVNEELEAVKAHLVRKMTSNPEVQAAARNLTPRSFAAWFRNNEDRLLRQALRTTKGE